MGSNDFDNRFPHVAERIRRYFRQHPGVAREKFFLDAVRREISFRERREKGRWKKGIWEEINGKIGAPGIPGRPKNNGKKIGKENEGKEDGGREDLEH
jgi:hypothetical protein